MAHLAFSGSACAACPDGCWQKAIPSTGQHSAPESLNRYPQAHALDRQTLKPRRLSRLRLGTVSLDGYRVV